jgi:hypothetical protein
MPLCKDKSRLVLTQKPLLSERFFYMYGPFDPLVRIKILTFADHVFDKIAYAV